LAELIISLTEFELNRYWRIGSRFKCHTESYGPQDLKNSQVRRYCVVYDLIGREEEFGYPNLELVAAFVKLSTTTNPWFALSATAQKLRISVWWEDMWSGSQPKLGST